MTMSEIRKALPFALPAQQDGMMVAVVGPSGAGKDSIINAARTRFAMCQDVVFARRVITRPADGNEPHEPVTEPLFHRGVKNGEFAMWWQANGLYYGLPAELHDEIETRHIVIANLSRERAEEARRTFRRCTVIHITASPDVLTMRLAARGRESSAEQAARLCRAQALEASVNAEILIANNGALDLAVNAFETAINRLRSRYMP